jgi:hypothetical protein
MDYTSPEFFIAIIAGIGTLLSAIKQNRQIGQANAETRMLKNMVSELQVDVQELKENDRKEKEYKDFTKDIRNSINENATIKINELEIMLRSHLEHIPDNEKGKLDIKKIVSGITDYFANVSEFSVKYYNSGFRSNDRVTKKMFMNYLEKSTNSFMFMLISTLNDSVKLEKAKKFSSKIIYIQFIEFFGTKDTMNKEPDCFQLVEILLEKLATNGHNNIQLKSLFLEFTENFIDKFNEKLQIFLGLEDYDTVIEKMI